MVVRSLAILLGALFLTPLPSAPLAAQSPRDGAAVAGRVVVRGRVEDAVTRAPVAHARVLAADSSAVVVTDEGGAFRIILREQGPHTVVVDRFGYLAERFELGPSAASRSSVLRLEPSPIPIQGVTVRDEAPLTRLAEGLQRRRRSAAGAVATYNRTDMAEFAFAGTVADFVRVKVPRLSACRSNPMASCVPGRVRSIAEPFPEKKIRICVDGQEFVGGYLEMETLPVRSVALVEIYGGARPGRISVYTADWVLWSVRTGRIELESLALGC